MHIRHIQIMLGVEVTVMMLYKYMMAQPCVHRLILLYIRPFVRTITLN